MNPNGRVPTIWDGDFSLRESNVRVRYLAAKYGDDSFYPENLGTRADADRWMDWQQTTLSPAYNDMHFGLIRTAPEDRNQKSIEASRKNTGGCMAILNEALAEHEFASGSLFTVADIALGVIPYRWFALDILRPRHVHLERWYNRLTEREPYRKFVMQPLPEWA
jgi:glutathione S-transferase